MPIRNETRNCILHESPEWALTKWQQARGFMFSTPGDRAKIFLFMPVRRVSLHMLFVFGPIDVLVLDGAGKVSAMNEGFRPWTLWDAKIKGSAVVELPAGTIARTKTRVGDLIKLPTPPIKRR